MPEIKQDIRISTFVVAANDSLHKNMADYVCDGVDDQVEIQAAIDAVSALPGGSVYLTEGKFNISDTISIAANGISLIGANNYTSTLFLVNNTDKDMIDVGGRNVELRSFKLLGNKGNQAAGRGIFLHYGASQDAEVNCVELYQIWGNGIECAGSFCRFNNLWVDACGGIGIYLVSRQNNQVIACHIVSNTGAAIRSYFGWNHIISHNNFSGNYADVIVLERSARITITDNSFFQSGRGAHNTHAVILLSHSGAEGAYDNLIMDNEIWTDETNEPAYGIRETSVYCHHNTIKNNRIANVATAALLSIGLGTIYSEQFSNIFLDALAASANHVVAAQALHLADPTNCVIAAQPDIPRTLSWTLTHPTLTAYTMDIVGVNAKGQPVTETFTEADLWAGETSNAFATVTSITVHDMTGAAAGDILDVGITDVLGLSNVIYATGDVYKCTKNGADYSGVGNITANATYDTVDVSTGGAIGAGDDFTIWYRSNLNILS